MLAVAYASNGLILACTLDFEASKHASTLQICTTSDFAMALSMSQQDAISYSVQQSSLETVC